MQLSIIQICSPITRGRVFSTEVTEVNLSAFVYRLFHEDPSIKEKSS